MSDLVELIRLAVSPVGFRDENEVLLYDAAAEITALRAKLAEAERENREYAEKRAVADRVIAGLKESCRKDLVRANAAEARATALAAEVERLNAILELHADVLARSALRDKT